MEGAQQQELQEQKRLQCGQSQPLQGAGQQSHCGNGNDEHRNREQMRERCLMTGKESRRDNDEIAGDMGREQAVQSDEADDVHAAGNEAQYCW